MYYELCLGLILLDAISPGVALKILPLIVGLNFSSSSALKGSMVMSTKFSFAFQLIPAVCRVSGTLAAVRWLLMWSLRCRRFGVLCSLDFAPVDQYTSLPD